MPAKFLIVEDHDAVRTALRAWLEVEFPESYVAEATSGEEAVVKIRSVSPHLVVMDFKLPGMNGFEATRQINATLPSVQIVMFSIREGDVYRASAISVGACAYVPKRTFQTELLPTIIALLDKSQD